MAGERLLRDADIHRAVRRVRLGLHRASARGGGIYYYFDFEPNSTKLVFASDSSKASSISGKSPRSRQRFSDAPGFGRLRLRGDCVEPCGLGQTVARRLHSQNPPLTLDASYSSGRRPSSSTISRAGTTRSRGSDPRRWRCEARRIGDGPPERLVTGTRLRVGYSFEIGESPRRRDKLKLFVVVPLAAGAPGDG